MITTDATKPAEILIVEDDELTATLIERRLQRLGYRIAASVRTGVEAMEKMAETHPDLVLMDIRLEGEMDGVEAARRIHEFFDVPVAYLTGCLDDETLARAAHTAPFGYVLKPFEEREVHGVIQLALIRHRLEKELDESRRWLSTILSAISDGVIATSPEGVVRFMNPVAERITGWLQSAALGEELARVFCVNRSIAHALGGSGEGHEPETAVLVARDGRRIPVEYNTALARDDKQSIVGLVWTFRDITERLRAEDGLRRDEQHFRTLIESASDVILVIDQEGMIYYVSPSVERLLGYQPEDAIGKRAAELVHDDDVADLRRFAREVRAGSWPAAVKLRARHRDGSWRQVEIAGSRLGDAADSVAVAIREVAPRRQRRRA